MTLTTHAIVGAAVAQLFPQNPVLAFAAGFLSHFAIDSLPHWDYTLLSLRENKENPLETDMDINKEFLLDIVRMGTDAFVGILLSILIFTGIFKIPFWIPVLGASAGLLPDFLQFVYFKTRLPILTPLQKFHIWIQKGKSLAVRPVVGIGLQAALIVALIILLVY